MRSARYSEANKNCYGYEEAVLSSVTDEDIVACTNEINRALAKFGVDAEDVLISSEDSGLKLASAKINEADVFYGKARKELRLQLGILKKSVTAANRACDHADIERAAMKNYVYELEQELSRLKEELTNAR